MEALKPCPNPWCFSTSSRMVKHNTCGFWIRCSCGVCGPVEGSREEAAAAWNTRPTYDGLVKALKVARANLQFLPPDDVVEQIDTALRDAGETISALR
jgi:hypothetical protein